MAKIKSHKVATSSAAWSSFGVVTAVTIIIFWILFPFYSYQLQIIFDQEYCLDQDNTSSGSCHLPSKENMLPYCPNTICQESEKGPDMFTKFFNSFSTIMKQIYTIVTGVVWIEVDKSITKMENDLHDPKPKKNKITNEQTENKTKSASVGVTDNASGTNIIKDALDATKKVLQKAGGFDDIPTTTVVNAEGDTAKTDESKVTNVVAADVATGVAVKQHDKAEIEKALKIFKSIPGLHINRKNFVNMAFCDISGRQMKDFYNTDVQKHVSDKTDGFDLFKYAPFSYIIPKEFGWPYTYLFNANDDKPTRYSKDGDKGNSSFISLMGAWFAKTQQRSWCTMRSLWSMILGLFLPFLKDDVTYEEIEEKLDAFVKALEKGFKNNEDGDSERSNMSDNEDGGALTDPTNKSTHFGGGNGIYSNFKQIQGDFKKLKDSKDTSPRIKLFNVMNEYLKLNIFDEEEKIKERVARTAARAAAGVKAGELNNDVNIYLRFFVAALRKAKYSGTRWFSNSIGLGGDAKYWMRYIITWYIPILTMVTMGITMFLGFWVTAFSSINRYSAFILPLFFGFFTSLYNMFALPASLFSYFIMGSMGKRPKSKKCPYDSGVYQMRRNFWQYLPLNIYLTLGIISIQLGATLTAIGKHTEGIVFTSLFPGLVLFVILCRILIALYNLM